MSQDRHARTRLEHRARSVHRKGPFVVAGLSTAVHLLCVIGTLTCAVVFFANPTQQLSRPLVFSLGLAIVTGVFAFFKRRRALCPLCKGTPLVNTGALPHSKATRLPPFSHTFTATLGVIFTQRFTCKYCGSRFDLLKPSGK